MTKSFAFSRNSILTCLPRANRFIRIPTGICSIHDETSITDVITILQRAAHFIVESISLNELEAHTKLGDTHFFVPHFSVMREQHITRLIDHLERSAIIFPVKEQTILGALQPRGMLCLSEADG